MEASQESHLPTFLKDIDNVSQETKNLISSLPSDKDIMGNGLYNYKGCWYYPNTLQAVLNVQKHFKPRDTDIIIASLPKGGTTWLKSLVFAVEHRDKYRENPKTHPLLSQNPHDLVPFLEFELYTNSQTPDLTKFPSPMIFSTHMHLQALRESTTKASSPCKIVYVCRGIKDTFVSSWHYGNKLLRTKMDQATFELMFDAYCRGVMLYGPYWEHVLSYWKGSLEDKENVLFMRYEELIEQPRVQVKRLADFLNCPFTEEEEEERGLVEEILKLCSLRNLSNLEVNKNGTTRIGIDSQAFFRKGEVGDWKNHLTPQMAKTVDEIIEYRLRGSGLIFQ